MKNLFKIIEPKNALAILPIPQSCLEEIENTLSAINNGEQGGIKDCITKLININKKNRFSKKSWARFAGVKESLDIVIEHTIMTFDDSQNSEYLYNSYKAYRHGTPQSAMFILNFDRCSGSTPLNNEKHNLGAYVTSRRTISVPLQIILKYWGNVENGYMIYEHCIYAMDHANPQFKPASYIGLTSRNWQTRYKEHQRDSLNCSELIFHTTLASVFNNSEIRQIGMADFDMVRNGVCLYSELQYVNLTYEEAMQIEEKMVERTLYPNGLNMIPGGFAGMKFLHKLGYLQRDRVTIDDRDFATKKFLSEKKNIRTAPWVTENWAKDDFYEKVIFKRNNTLNREQILSIRKYGNDWGFDAEIIANLSGANIRQVRDVLSGKYYSRIK